MKKQLLTLAALICATIVSAQFAVKITPFTFLKNQYFMLHGEYIIPGTEKLSIGLGVAPNMVPKTSFLDDLEDVFDGGYYYEYNQDNWLAGAKPGFAIDPELRWYFKEAYDGFFMGLYSSQRFSSGVRLEELYTGKEDPLDPLSADLIASPTGGYVLSKSHISIYGLQMGFCQTYGGDNNILLDVYFGAGTKNTNITWSKNNLEGPGRADTDRSSIALRANVAVGYIFK
jgi:hypothetical protein